MSTKYLLPCECGKSIPVATSQAGSQVACECGAEMEVPTMRGLRELEREEEESPQAGQKMREKSWDPRYGVGMLGAIVAVVAAIPGIVLLVQYPEKPTFDEDLMIQREHARIDRMPLPKAWQYWKLTMETAGLKDVDYPTEREYAKKVTIYQQNIAISFSFAALGLLIMLGAVLWNPRPVSPPQHSTAGAA